MVKSIIFLLASFVFTFHANAQDNSKFNFLKTGDIAPAFQTLDHAGNKIDSKELLKKGKIVLMFYRGAWCPYCNRHMSDVQDSLEFIIDRGATLIAVSPELPESIDKTIKKTKATFSIIHDKDHKFMNLYGTAFKVDDGLVNRYKVIGIDLEKSNGNKSHILPVTATFIINQQGVIEAMDFDENYKIRMSVAEILEHL